MQSLLSLRVNLSSLAILKELREESPLKELCELLNVCYEKDDPAARSLAYAGFISALYEGGADLGNAIKDLVICSDNRYVRMAAAGIKIPANMEKCFFRELEILSAITLIKAEDLKEELGLDEMLPDYDTTGCDLEKIMPGILKDICKLGYGMYARYGMFRIDKEGKIIPVLSPDPITIHDLIGYENERNKIINNVKALIKGKPAANMLLVGDAGTGKSSTVKATCNLLYAEGVRLVELKKEQLPLLPEVISQVADNPLKFILFVDDLSFDSDESGFGALKAVLEGSASAKTPNVIICATSNRRHMIKETFSSREGDEIHRRDTIEEQTSLSARFGLSVLFVKPDKDLYLKIVDALAEEAKITLEKTELHQKAEAFAIARGGRSARKARQFVDQLISSEE